MSRGVAADFRGKQFEAQNPLVGHVVHCAASSIREAKVGASSPSCSRIIAKRAARRPLVRNADPLDLWTAPNVRDDLGNKAAEAGDDLVVLDRHDGLMLKAEISDFVLVGGLDGRNVEQGMRHALGVQNGRGFKGPLARVPRGNDANTAPFFEPVGLAQLKPVLGRIEQHGRIAAMAPHIDQTRRIDRDVHGLLKLGHVHGINDGRIRYGAHHTEVFGGLMVDACGVGDARCEAQNDAGERSRPHADHHLVIGAAGGVTGEGRCNGNEACLSNASGDRNQVLLGHTDIEVLVWQFVFDLNDLAILAQICAHHHHVLAT